MKEYHETAPPQLQRVLVVRKVSENGITKLAILSARNQNGQDGQRRGACKLIRKHRLHRSSRCEIFVPPFHIIKMAEKSSQKAPPRATISRHISAPTTQLPAILTDYFKPKSRSEIRSTRPKLTAELQRHRQKIHPIVRISPSADYGGFTHGVFPKTYFHYCLLTENVLDSLAAFYHQDVQGRWSDQYPKRMRWRSDLSYEDKRMEFGRFLGFRGCDRPHPLRPSVESFKMRVIEMVAEWRFSELPEPEHVPGDAQAAAVARRFEEKRMVERLMVERVRRERVRVLVAKICRIDAVLEQMGVEPAVWEAPPTTYEEACGEVRKSWRKRLEDFRRRK